ncbi:hypothetical protein [Parasitella parasitica]|uniref:VPS9 domain-containing protein n=1 Tax=Parasitella parasitica TaxID=35722 RepID=A0A0B7NEX2_9FUNG|nr:hypothetical protein [Parasitella parasitica]
MATKQKQKIIALDHPIITTIIGFKEERTVHIMDEESVYLKNKKIKVLSIDRLLEGDPPAYHHHKHAITIPPVRNSRTDLEFLNMFSENLEALYELQIAVQEFTDSYVYIKGYNKNTVERIQHMYMKTYRTILQRNKLLQESCRTPSEHDQFLELVENVVMSFLHKKIWIQSLQSLLASQDNYIDTICYTYSNVTLSQYSLRYPISEMHLSCFDEAITNFRRLDTDNCNVEPHKSASKLLAFTPLEKLAVVKSTLDLISSAVHDYVRDFGNGNSDTSVTSDEMIPLLAFVIVQSNVPRLASLVYYMQYYRLARMAEGSVYSFVITTTKSACEFLKDDPLSLNDIGSATSSHSSIASPQSLRSRSTSFSSLNKPNSAPPQHQHMSSTRYSLHHRKSQSADLGDININQHHQHHHSSLDKDMMTELRISVDEDGDDDDDHCSITSSSSSCRNSALLRPHIVLPNPRHAENRKSLDIPNDWLLPNSSSPRMTGSSSSSNRNYYQTNGYKPFRNLGSSRPMVSATFPSLSNSTPLPLDALPSSHYHHHLQTSSPPLQPASSPLRLQQYHSQDQQQQEQQHPQYHHHLPSVPSISSVADLPKLGRSLSASTVVRKKMFQQPPKVITIRDRISFDSIQRPASICLDTRSLHSIEDGGEESEELMGDFLLGLSKLDGDVVGGRTGSFKTFKRM